MNYGYIRVSTRDQNEERQRLAMGELDHEALVLEAAGQAPT